MRTTRILRNDPNSRMALTDSTVVANNAAEERHAAKSRATTPSNMLPPLATRQPAPKNMRGKGGVL